MLKIDKLSKQYDKKLVLDDVSFEINKGEIITILGANGAGKTTIIDSILKLVKPSSGNILYNGENIYKIKNKKYFKNISVLLESSSNVYDFLSGMQNIEYFCGLSKIKLKNIVKKREISILLTTHQMDVVQKIGGKVLLLKNGKIEIFDSINAICTKNEKYKIIYYDNQNRLIQSEENLTFNEIYHKYSKYNIQEIKKVDIDIEKIVMEKLHESI